MKKGLAELVFVIDRSGSMSGLEEDTIGGFNTMLRDQKEVEGEAVVTTVLFDNDTELLHDRVDIKALSPMTKGDYQVRGCTALLDAIGMVIHKIHKAHQSMNDDYVPEKTMFFIITDGLENASHHYTAGMIKERVEHQKKKHGWEFLFFGANMDAICEAGKIGIDKEHVTSYQADAKGIARSYQQMSYTSSMYRSVDILERDIDWTKGENKQDLNRL